MAPKKQVKRLGKKHRQASTRPHKGKSPKSAATTGATRIGAVDPKKRKELAAKKAKEAEKKRVSRRSPEFEAKRTITGDDAEKVQRTRGKVVDPAHPEETPMNGAPRAVQGRTSPGRSFRSASQQQAAQEREGKGSGGPRRRITSAKSDSP